MDTPNDSTNPGSDAEWDPDRAWPGDAPVDSPVDSPVGAPRDASPIDARPTPVQRVGIPEQDRRWLTRALGSCLEVARRLAPAYGRRLLRQHLPVAAHEDLLTLAARRVLPLRRPIQRRLPRSGMTERARAFAALVPADRRVLLDVLGGEPGRAGPGRSDSTAGGEASSEASRDGRIAVGSGAERLEHAAAALERLARNVRSARRHGGGAPIGATGQSTNSS